MKKHLVLAGGGHAHLTTLLKLKDYVRKGHRVTLISPSEYHYYSGMGPGMLSGIYRPHELRFHIRKTAEDRGADFICDLVVSIDPYRRILHLKSGMNIPYDIVSFNTGSSINQDFIDIAGKSIYPVKPIENLLAARERILDEFPDMPGNIIIAGGGPAGVEISANVWRLLRDNNLQAEIYLISAGTLMVNFPRRVRNLVVNSFRKRKIRILEQNAVKSLTNGNAMLSDGSTMPFAVAFLASGVRPSNIFRKSGLETGKDGGLLVNSSLQSITYPEIFGGGDCISFREKPLPKIGVHAVRQNTILYHNLLAALGGNRLLSYSPQTRYLLIFNMGDGKGIFWRNRLVFYGRLPFLLKNHIDRKFMRQFQVSGELDEPAHPEREDK